MMRGRGDTGAALGSGAVDDQFWALVCEDEEWLKAEFDAIVSAPAEVRRRSGARPSVSAPDTHRRRAVPPGERVGVASGRSRRRGRRWSRERSPPIG